METLGRAKPGEVFNLDFVNHVMQLKWLGQWLKKMSQETESPYLLLKVNRGDQSIKLFTLKAPKDFLDAFNDVKFKKLLDFLAIKQCSGDTFTIPEVSWPYYSSDGNWPPYTFGRKFDFVSKIAFNNLPEGGDLIDVDWHCNLEELRWLKSLIESAIECRKSGEVTDINGPMMSNESDPMNQNPFERLLLFLEFEPPFEERQFWLLPTTTVDTLESKVKFLHDLILTDVKVTVKCRKCNVNYTNLLLHLRKNEQCAEKYSDFDFEEMKEASKHFSKFKAKDWRKANKELISKRNAERYQEIKATLKKPSKEKQTEIYQRYYAKNKEKIAATRAEYYKKNKAKIAEKYQEKKKANSGLEKK